MLIVAKFGGSSLADPQALLRAANICREIRGRGRDLVVVVSAMGDTTDELVALAQQISPRPSQREMDALTTTGEQQSAALMAICLESLGIKALSLTGWQAGILTDSSSSGSDIKLICPGRIEEAIARGAVAVVTGYQGFDTKGDITSLGRGGSDISAAALAAAMRADECRIYTDVAGIYTADPRQLPQAVLMEQIDRRDMLALAQAGSQVLHPKAVELAMANGLDMRLLSSLEPGPGSLVCSLKDSRRPNFAGVTRDREKGSLSIAGKAASPRALSALLLMLAKEGLEIEDVWLSPNLISLLPKTEHTGKVLALLHDRVILPQYQS